MKTIIAAVCGIGLIMTIMYSILGLFPSWSVIIPVVVGGKLVK